MRVNSIGNGLAPDGLLWPVQSHQLSVVRVSAATKRVQVEIPADGISSVGSDPQRTPPTAQTDGSRSHVETALAASARAPTLGFGTEPELTAPHRTSRRAESADIVRSPVPRLSFFAEQPGRPYSIVGPSLPQRRWMQGVGPADTARYDVTIDGHTICVWADVAGDWSDGRPRSVEEVARAVAKLPPWARSRLNEVYLSSKAPRCEPGVFVLMTSDEGGVVTVYPVPEPFFGTRVSTIDHMSATLLHEVGHLILFEWGDDPSEWSRNPTPSPALKAYIAAIEADPVYPSKYAKTSVLEDLPGVLFPFEDFAEMLAMYAEYRGTEDEVELRAQMPARYSFMDQLFASGQLGDMAY
jgi:hypothetical protein